MMQINLTPDLEEAIGKVASERGISIETVALEALCTEYLNSDEIEEEYSPLPSRYPSRTARVRVVKGSFREPDFDHD
jgi:hypothetical protein